jgi:chromate transporter
MIPLIKREIVDKHRWMEEKKFIEALAVTQSAPGAVAVNLAVFFGYNLAGTLGALITTLGVVLPSFLIILLIAFYFSKFSNYKIIVKSFQGIRPAVIGLILYAGIDLARSIKWSPFLTILFLIVFFFRVGLQVNPAALIAISIMGVALYYLISKVKK